MRDVSSWPELARLQYFAARFAYKHRDELTPLVCDLDGEWRRVTWGTWFARRFGVTLDDYRARLE